MTLILVDGDKRGPHAVCKPLQDVLEALNGACLTQVVLETHSATTAFNLSHAEEAPAEENYPLDQRYSKSTGIQTAQCVSRISGIK